SVVQLRDVRTGAVLASLPQDARAHSVAWQANGRALAVGLAEAHRVRLYDTLGDRLSNPAGQDGLENRPGTLQPFRTLETDHNASSLAFNHAGDRLAVHGWSLVVELFDVGTGQRLVATTPTWGGTPRFSRDDQRLAGAVLDGKLGIWRIGEGREYRT